MTFGERLKMLRQEKEVTQSVIGDLIDVSARMISFYESSTHFPNDANTLIKLATFFNVSLDYLLGFSHIRNYNELIKTNKAYISLPEKGRQEADEYMLFLRQKYKVK